MEKIEAVMSEAINKLNSVRSEREYENPQEFINDLMDNEGIEFSDNYGRFWMYKNMQFVYKDLSDTEWSNGIFCLHLYGIGIKKEI